MLLYKYHRQQDEMTPVVRLPDVVVARDVVAAKMMPMKTKKMEATHRSTVSRSDYHVAVMVTADAAAVIVARHVMLLVLSLWPGPTMALVAVTILRGLLWPLDAAAAAASQASHEGSQFEQEGKDP